MVTLSFSQRLTSAFLQVKSQTEKENKTEIGKNTTKRNKN